MPGNQATAPTDKILAETGNGIGWLILNHPERRNAINLAMWRAIGSAMQAFEHDPAVRVIVLRGAGDKAFTAGADISEFETQRSTVEQKAAYDQVVEAGKGAIGASGKPVIAMIQGFCMGGGVAVALLADLRVASDTAVFGIPAARLGVAYGSDSLTRLTGLVGPALAKEMLFTGRRLGAEEALRIGLLNRVSPAASLEAAVQDLALEIARNAPLSVRAAKIGIDQTMLDPAARDPALIASSARACLESEDYVTGRQAFLAKQVPEFKGR